MLLRLVLEGYMPLTLKGVKRISLGTNSIYNIILGRNGYGKTSILRELSPLPPDNGDYQEGGIKEIEYQIKDKHYKLISKTGKKSEHYFYVNGENINKGMTLLVQKELVRIHFRITPEIKNIITGIDKGDLFTSLSPQRRKQILMEINPNDTSYALSVFEKIKTEYNNTKGALKHQRQLLSAELKRQEEIKSTPIEELNYEVKLLDEQIKDALILHGSLQHITEPDIHSLKQRLEKMLLKLLECPKHIQFTKSYYIEMIDRYNSFIDSAREKQIGLETLIKDITNKINQVTPSPDFNIKGYEERKQSLDIEIIQLDKQRHNLLEIISRESFFKQSEWENEDFLSDIVEFINQLHHVEISPDKAMTCRAFLSLVEQQKEIENKVNVLSGNIDKARRQLEHYHGSDDVKCPDCKHQFKVGFEQFNAKQLEGFLTSAIAEKEKKQSELNAIVKKIELNESWFYSMNAFMRYIKHTRDPKYIMDIIKYFDIGKTQQDRLINLLNMINQYHKLSIEEDNKRKEQTTLDGYYRLMNEYDIKELYNNLEHMSAELGTTQRYIQRCLTSIKQCEKSLEWMQAHELLKESYINLANELDELLVQKGKWHIRETVARRINYLKPRKDDLAAKLIRTESMNSIIESIREQVNILDKREKHLLFLMNSLSPTKGFIGHLMLDFLKSVCGNVNAIIENIWTDSLRLLSPDIDEDNTDLDYKFRVVTTEPTKPISDIKKCSGGEKDLIDFAIRYTLLRYLGGESGLMLIMDEPGVAFDELNRKNFIHYISNELRLGKLPQTFMVSHYVSQYGIFKNNEANLICLNSEGLNIPDNVNTHVEIS